jgi:hypothetical protein
MRDLRLEDRPAHTGLEAETSKRRTKRLLPQAKAVRAERSPSEALLKRSDLSNLAREPLYGE